MSLRRTPSPPNHRAEKPAHTNNMPVAKSASTTTKVVMVTDTTLASSLQAQLVVVGALLAAAQAQIVTDEAAIASLEAQVISIQASLAASSLKFYIKVISGYVTDEGGIYVPPSYVDETVSYTSIFKPKVKTLSLYTVTGGGYP